jgi:hypothetical protein
MTSIRLNFNVKNFPCDNTVSFYALQQQCSDSNTAAATKTNAVISVQLNFNVIIFQSFNTISSHAFRSNCNKFPDSIVRHITKHTTFQCDNTVSLQALHQQL